MTSRRLFFLSLFTAISFAAVMNVYSYQGNTIGNLLIFPTGSTYGKEWRKVDSLSNKGLYKSALDVTNGIYEKAKKENDAPQLVKAIIHRMKFEQYMEEYSLEKAITKLQAEANEAKYPLKPMLQSMLAETYWSYYQHNRYKFAQRTQTVNFKMDDIQTWDLKTIVDQVIKNYELSLQNSDSLKRTNLKIYDEVLNTQYDSKKYRPTLYDFLAHRALSFYENTEPEITKPAYHFEINSEDYFRPYDVFSRYRLENKDSMSLKYYAVRIFQEMLAFHSNDADPVALINDELERLKFVHSYSTSEIKDSLYLESLRGLEKKFYTSPASTEVTFEVADVYYTAGMKYKPLQSDENKWKCKEAIAICEEAMKRFPDAMGAYNCKQLIERIKQKNFNFEVEKVNAPGKPFVATLQYHNLKKVYFRACPMDIDKFNKAVENLYGEELVKKYLALKSIKEWSVDLPDDGDYQVHRTEIKVPELPLGHYVIIGANEPTFSYKSNAVAYASCWASNLSYVNRKMTNGSYDFYVMQRSTGAPLKGVNAQLWYERYNYTFRKYEYVKAEKFTTDAKGYFNVPPGADYRNFNVQFTYNDTAAKGPSVKDELHTDYAIYQYREYPYEKRTYTKTFFFTDRAIYRPGQTVYFKGIMISTDGEENNILPNRSTTVTFYDVNSQKVASLDLTTNEYGSFNGSFTAPNGVLNGQMYLSDSHGSIYFSVEDYKRPKFEVTMNPVKGSYRLGDKISAQGLAKSYAGAPIDGAQVKYRVVRDASFPYWWYYWRGYYPSSPEMEIANGTVTTNETGGFVIDFNAIPDASISKSSFPTYSFTIYADVTDINGETHSSQGYVNVAYTSLNLSVNIGDKIDKNGKTKFPVSTTNLSGQFEPANGTFAVYKLLEPNKVFRKRTWEVPDKFVMKKDEFYAAFPNDVYSNEDDMYKWEKGPMILSASFSNTRIPAKNAVPEKDINDSLNITNLKQWASGVYVLESKTKDKYGVEVKDVKYFTVYSTQDNVVPANLTDWFTEIKQDGEPGEKASFLIGSKYNDVKVLYEVEHKNAVAQQQWLSLNSEQKVIEIPIEEKHRGNFAVHFLFIKNGRVYNYDRVITVPYTNKEVDMEFESFRNKLLPGQKEEWKIKVKGHNGEKLAAEMLATMYDASLDAFRPNSWAFSIYNTYYSSLYWQQQGFGDNVSQLYSEYWNVSTSYNYHYFDALNWFGYYMNGGYDYYHDLSPDYEYDEVTVNSNAPAPPMEKNRSEDGDVTTKTEYKKGGKDSKEPMSTGSVSNITTTPMGGSTTYQWSFGDGGNKNEEQSGADKNGKQNSLAGISARTNLNETAFFYPTLETDKDGNVIIKFTIPEALTKWKMMGFAHTKDLKFGQISKELVTQKEIMVIPNPPRFFRENDKISFSTKISNLSGKDLEGKVDLILYDATTMKEISTKMIEAVSGPFNTIGERDFSVKKGLSTSISWELSIPEGVGAIDYKVVAKAGDHSDGEEMVVPVLTNRMLVTETMPLPIRSNQTKTFSFDKLISQNGGSSTLRNNKLTLEFTSNPAWYAVQSLPYLMEYPYECAEQTFSRYYANSIASHIANSSPKIKAVFDSWRSKSPDAFLSNLQKNQELKSLMLEETPWVLEAKDESERKKRVGLLFDLNKMSNELDRALFKLQKMQVSNGGWPWFEGMPDDRYITQYIVTGMGHLDHLGVKNIREDSKTWNMVKDGVRYLDDRIREDYEWILKYDKAHLNDDHIWYEEIQYLYARSYFKDVPVSNRDQKAFDYYKGQAQKYWLSKGRYMQGMIALALKRYDDKKTPLDIMKSLKETSLNSEEMGMYWKDNYENSGWYWYQAPIESQALLIEAFDEVSNDKKSVDDLKVWLLKSKQTQDWKTTKATTEACFALLLRGTDWLSNESNVEIIVGTQKIDPKNLPNEQKPEAGTGYFKTSWSGAEIKPEMGKVTVTKKDEGVSWGAMYWQYFEQLDKITSAKTPLSMVKKLFIEKNTESGPVLTPVGDKTPLKIGDKIKVRIELRVDRDMEYVHMKDMRASGFEPTNVFSNYKYQDGLGYYESTRDASTNFFFARLPKGTYVFEYPLVVAQAGDFSNGITSIQCMYAPEFSSHSEGIRVKVSK